MYIKTLSVSALNNYIKKTLDNDFILSNSMVKGELSNFKVHSSGHIYFSLKDANSKINCIMFKSSAKDLKFLPENGMSVVIKGRVSVYEKEGNYQLYVNSMELDGVGELYATFEKLKNKLLNEGLFDEVHKKALPKYVKKIGVITSPTGAAIRDILNVVNRRNKTIDVLIYPALVQGVSASKDIINGINQLNKSDVDIIILARGGGSIEELWSFNDESLAYSVFNSKKPIVTGVGHETDFTIVDFVSDRRAPTPSAAAEICVYDLNEAFSKLQFLQSKLLSTANSKIENKFSTLQILKNRLESNNPEAKVANEYRRIDSLKEILQIKVTNNLEKKKEALSKLNSLLIANNPLAIINKGYSIIQDEKENLISSVEELKKEKSIFITLKDGRLKTDIDVK